MAKSTILNSVEEVIEDFRNGRIVIVVDDEDRENEGDFIVAAEKITPEIVNFMLKEGRGVLCAPLSEDRCAELGLNMMEENNTSLLGWGVQFSGTIKCCDWFRLFMNGVYGEGITPYIQDLTGSGLDFTPNPEDPSLVRMMPMWGWQAAGQINITPRLFVSGGYSTVRVQRSHGYYTDDQYKQGQYIFGNIFYSLTPRCKVAGEYLYGSRKDMNSMKNHANRVNVMVQYSF